jgi:hypothetical protein
VKHRSPLVTLATVLVAFVIMFTVNMLSGPPGRSPAGTADAPVGSASGSASSGSPQPTETAVVWPLAGANACNAKDGSAVIAEVVLGNQSAVYFCDGRNVESWLGGTDEGADITMNPNDRTTDSLPISRRTVIINTAVALLPARASRRAQPKEGRARA